MTGHNSNSAPRRWAPLALGLIFALVGCGSKPLDRSEENLPPAYFAGESVGLAYIMAKQCGASEKLLAKQDAELKAVVRRSTLSEDWTYRFMPWTFENEYEHGRQQVLSRAASNPLPDNSDSEFCVDLLASIKDTKTL